MSQGIIKGLYINKINAIPFQINATNSNSIENYAAPEGKGLVNQWHDTQHNQNVNNKVTHKT